MRRYRPARRSPGENLGERISTVATEGRGAVRKLSTTVGAEVLSSVTPHAEQV
jgi:hypothetical protein